MVAGDINQWRCVPIHDMLCQSLDSATLPAYIQGRSLLRESYRVGHYRAVFVLRCYYRCSICITLKMCKFGGVPGTILPERFLAGSSIAAIVQRPYGLLHSPHPYSTSLAAATWNKTKGWSGSGVCIWFDVSRKRNGLYGRS